MKKNKDIVKKVDKALAVLDLMQEVKVSTSFKQRVLEKAIENKEQSVVVQWFTPKLQLAAMIIVLLVNVSAIMYVFSSSTSSTINLDSFAQEYNLSSNASIIN